MNELKIILEAGIPVLLFSGQYDVICHHLGTEKALQNLEWNGKDGWIKAEIGIWTVDNHPEGYVKAFKNLQFLVVLQSGHMVYIHV